MAQLIMTALQIRFGKDLLRQKKDI